MGQSHAVVTTTVIFQSKVTNTKCVVQVGVSLCQKIPYYKVYNYCEVHWNCRTANVFKQSFNNIFESAVMDCLQWSPDSSIITHTCNL